MANVVSMKQLLEAGVHFGHQTRRWNPKMAEYIFTERNGIYIIDLQKTVKKLDEAYMFVRDLAAEGGSIIFVGTKKQAQESVKEEAERCAMPYVNARWLGGMLTNFKTIRGRVARLAQLKAMREDGTFDLLPKKEVALLKAERDKLETNLGGIKEMREMPGVIFVVDPSKEHICVREAIKMHIPLVGLVDTNCDPSGIDYVIPGNDDAIRSVKLIASAIADAVIEAREGVSFKEENQDEEPVDMATALSEVKPTVEDAEPTVEEETHKKPRAKKVKEVVETEEVKATEEKVEKPKRASKKAVSEEE